MAKSNGGVLRCYAERESDGTWFAMCLDLNLYARAGSADEARAQLHQIIVDHLSTVRDMPAEDRHALVPRPAPLRFRLRYAYLLAKSVIGAIFHPRPPSSGSPFRKFDEPMTA